jgi:colanic acid/amylovoran biosynthesis glycosyltransferase
MLARSPRAELDPAAAADAGTRSVLYLCAFLPTFVASEVRELTRRGIRVTVLMPPVHARAALWNRITDAEEPARRSVRTIDYYRWLAEPRGALVADAAALLARVARRSPRQLRRIVAGAIGDGALRYWLAAAFLHEALGSHTFTRVHCHFATEAAQVGARLAALAGAPFSLTTHANDIFAPRRPRELRRVLACARPLFTISAFNRAHLARIAGDRIGRCARVVRAGIDTGALPSWMPARDPFTIACVASGLAEKKGVAVLLDACALLAARGHRIRCAIYGSDPPGDRLAALRAAVAAAPPAFGVDIAGALPWRDTQAAIARADVFAAPALRTAAGEMDGIPVSLMEAMAIGLPVVASALSGIPELVEHERNGLLVPPANATALADAIERVIRDPAAAAAFGRRARRRVDREFSIRDAVDGLVTGWNATEPITRSVSREEP